MKNVLFLIDVQNDFIDGALRNQDAIDKVGNIVNLVTCKNWDHFMITMDTHPENYERTREGKALPVRHCITQSEGWKINKSVASVLPESPIDVLVKNTFGSKGLLSKCERTFAFGENCNFVFAGFCTDICVISNVVIARSACPEAEIYVVKDCVAGVTPELNEAALKVMESLQVKLIDLKEVENL